MKLLAPPKNEQTDRERSQFTVFSEACRILESAGIPHVMGGGVAIRAYGRARPCKDGDVFLQKEHVFQAMDALTRFGAFHTRDTDASWLFKAIKGEVLVDLIVRTTGNIAVTAQTCEHARLVELYGYRYRVMGPEDVLFRKIHSHREGRPDQFDALSMLKAPLANFDWSYFLALTYTNDVRRVLGFLLWAQSELPEADIPFWVIRELNERVMSAYALSALEASASASCRLECLGETR